MKGRSDTPVVAGSGGISYTHRLRALAVSGLVATLAVTVATGRVPAPGVGCRPVRAPTGPRIPTSKASSARGAAPRPFDVFFHVMGLPSRREKECSTAAAW
jgi:hypothetical protein